jgi:predicted nucleic acid-binding protein
VNFLADTSALVRIIRRQVSPQWGERSERGAIAVCEPVLTETLTIAGARVYEQAEQGLADLYPWVPVPGGAWTMVRDMRRALAARSAHQGISVADYLIAVTAIHHDLTLLHDDADFETVATIVPALRQERISG